jgi:pimeloyl-ACP methyl ester carboxylesterase
MDFAEVDGLRIAYTMVGKGPPVFLLHGYVGDGRAAWRYQIDGLSDHFTVVAWDAPGVGGSSDPPESFGMAGYADCLARFIGSVGYDRVHIVGISFGGALALELCRRHPDVVASLVLASAYAGWGGSLPTDVAEARLQQAFSLAELSPDQFVDTLLPTMFSEGTPSESVEEFGRSMRAFHSAGFRAMALACAEDLRDALPSVRVPTLLIYGEADIRAPAYVAAALHQGISGSRLVTLPRTGHACNIEAPDLFNQTVKEFLITVDELPAQ